jgi:ElaB/YqjD/DUF883 family membrane-anchored ribosome-binding protein
MMTGMTHGNDKIAEALRLLDEAAAEKKSELASMLTDNYGTLKSVIMESESGMAHAVAQGKARAIEAAMQAKELGIEKAKRVDEHVHRNPWQYIGGAAVIGLLFGYILGRKDDR